MLGCFSINYFLSIDVHGYLLSHHTDKSRAGNEFFDVKVKTSETEILTVRIMKSSNQSITMAHLMDLKQAQAPLVFTNLSSSSNGVYFFNSYKDSRIENSTQVTFPFANTEDLSISQIKTHTAGSFDVIGCIKFVGDVSEVQSAHDDKTNFLRDALIFDEKDNMPLTIWNDLIQQIEEDKWYSFTDLNLKHYFGLKLSTTKRTTVSNVDMEVPIPSLSDDAVTQHQSHSDDIHHKLNPILCCPEISSVNIEILHCCVNKTCLQIVTTIPGKRVVSCQHCKNTMRADKVVKKFHCTIVVGEGQSLMLPLDVLESFFNLESSLEDVEDLKEKLLFMENVDFTINTKGVITKMEGHL